MSNLKYFRTGCLLKLVVSVPALTDDELADILAAQRLEVTQQRKQQRKDKHRRPMQSGHGPQHPWPWQRSLAFMRQDTRVRMPPSEAETCSWLQTVSEAFHAADVSQILAALKQFPFHGSYAHEIGHLFQSNDLTTTEHTEQCIALHEAIN